MLDEPYYICYLTDDISERDRSEAIDCCLEAGLVPVDEANEPLEENTEIEPRVVRGSEHVDFMFGSLNVTLTSNLGDTWDWNEPTLLVSLSANETGVEKGETVSDSGADVDRFIDVIGSIAETMEPEYVWGMHIPSQHESAYRPVDRPIVNHIDSLSWITVFGPSTVADLGGRDRVLSAPAARVEALESGHVLVVKTDEFFRYEYGTDAVDQYLLEGVNLDDLEAGGEDERVDHRASEETPAFDDPFLEFEAGDIGADVVVEKDAVGGDLSNADLQLRRVRLDENGHLRELETDAFVRRRYGPDGQIGSLPPDGDTAEELFPPLALNGVPVEFVRLSDPDGENVLTKCMALDVEIDRFEFLVRLSSSVLNDGYTAADIESVENMLDSVGALEDVDGIEQLVRDRLL